MLKGEFKDMSEYKMLDVEPKNNYEKAKQDLIKAGLSFDKLTEQEKEKLITEAFGIEAMQELKNILSR